MSNLRVHDLEMSYTERGDGPTVVALHAATSSGAEMGWLSYAIAHEGFNVVTPDLRGHGSTPNPGPDLHLTRLVDDLLEFVYLLGRTPLHAAGFSLGGAVALYAARCRPDLFQSLMLLGTNTHAPTPERLTQALGPVADRPAIQQTVFDPQCGVGVGWDAPLASFGVVTSPTLIIAADRDEFNDVEDNLALYRALPNAEVLIVPRCDHLGLVKHPLVLEALRQFYARVPR